MTVVGFIGLGVMGAPMSRNILKAGFACRVYDVDPSATAKLVEVGAAAASSPADCARGASIVITMLPNGAIVEQALFGPHGVAAGMAPGTLVVDMSTILPAQTDDYAARVAAGGGRFVDAPVGRSSAHAVSGKLMIMVGGMPQDVEEVRPVLATMGDTIEHCGPAGSGSRMKVVNNFMSITLNATTVEALLLAETSGLDPELARRVMLSTVAGQGHMNTTYPAKVLKGDLEPGFAIDLAHKDLLLALEMAGSLKVDLVTGKAALSRYDAAREAGRGRQDWTALYADARSRAGLEPY
jgi:4-hydroxybutyrate dehydrogenase / sulfolactaldehyde 3-reductase